MKTAIAHSATTAHATSSRLGVVIVLCAVAIWSTTPVFIDQLQTAYHMTPLQVSTWRVLLVTAFLGLYLLVRRPSVFKLHRREIGYYVLYGIVGVSLFNLAFNTSVAINKAAAATTLMFCAPVFVALGSWRNALSLHLVYEKMYTTFVRDVGDSQ